MARGKQTKRFQAKAARAQLDHETRLANAIGFKDKFFVDKTSGSDNGGYGLYSLKTFDAGVTLPMVYPGVKAASDEEFDKLNTYLVSLTQRPDHAPFAVAVKRLKERWNIHIVPDEPNPKTSPFWDNLYDNFVAYRIENTYWNVYHWTGHIKAHIVTPKHAPLYINEAPDCHSFVNAFTEKPQRSAYNVETFELESGEIAFKSKRKIRYGDELLLDYGPFYNRTYPRLRPGKSKGIFQRNFISNS